MNYPHTLWLLLLILMACEPGQQTQTKDSSPSTAAEVISTKENEIPTPTKLSTPDTAYVIAKSGLRVRSKPSLEGERIGVRPYGKKVLITERSNIKMTVQDEGKEVSGEWLGIESRLVKQGKVEVVTGYIFSGFLSKERVLSEAVNITYFLGNQAKKGIGGLVLKNSRMMRRPNLSELAADDTVRLYDADLKTVHTFASYWYLNFASKRHVLLKDKNCVPHLDKNRLRYESELGMGNFVYVKEIKEGFAYLGELCGKAVWVNLAELDKDKVSFRSHSNIFAANPKGGGWEHGYTYVGSNKVLRAEPDLEAKALLSNIAREYEIYIIGSVKNNWAKVKVREAEQVFGEMYFEKSVYGKSWEGWIMITEPDGTPLIEPHIFGC